MAVSDEFVSQVSEALDELGYSLDQQQDVIEDASEINDDVTLPGIRVDGGGAMTGYVSMKLAVLRSYLDGVKNAIQAQWTAWFGNPNDDTAGVKKTWKDWFTARQSDWSSLSGDIQTATQAATDAAQASATATQGAERVNAGLVGYTVTITDRTGVSRSVDIGFEIYRTYASVSAMNADAANVPQGKFVVIATTDATDPDNAKMYCKNSQGTFTFLCDLDQASSSAWADWLNNMKPVIQQATTDANNAATNANNKAGLANDKAGLANDKAALADEKAGYANTQGTYAKNQGDYAKELADHPAYIGDGTTGDENYWYLYDMTAHQYVKGPYAKGDDLDYSTMTPEEIQQLVENIKESIVFATDQVCEDIIDEL